MQTSTPTRELAVYPAMTGASSIYTITAFYLSFNEMIIALGQIGPLRSKAPGEVPEASSIAARRRPMQCGAASSRTDLANPPRCFDHVDERPLDFVPAARLQSAIRIDP